MNTTLVIGDTVDDEGGSTVIAVSASLHNDEVTEFPEEEEVDEVEEIKGPDKQLVMLADYLNKLTNRCLNFSNQLT